MNFHYVTINKLQAASLAALLAQYKLDEYAGGVSMSIELISHEAISYVEVEFYPESGHEWARWHILDNGDRYIVKDKFR